MNGNRLVTSTFSILITTGVALGAAGAGGCGFWAVKEQQDAMVADMAARHAANEIKQREQTKRSFQQSYDAQESAYAMMRSKLELYESKYQDWLGGATSPQKKTSEFASVTKVHDELKGRVDALEADHGGLVQWYEQSKERPTSDDLMKLAQSYGSYGQKQQLYFSNYVDLDTRTMSISARKK
jgi:hypothetical protein